MTIRFSVFSFNETIEERNLSKLWKPRWTVYKRLFRLLQETFQRSSHLEQTKQCPTFTYLSFFLTFITSFFLYAAHINRKLACLNAKFLKVKWRSSCLSQCSDKISLSFEILSNICVSFSESLTDNECIILILPHFNFIERMQCLTFKIVA